METLGPINETGITFVADIGRLLTQATDEARETSFIFQRLSVTIQIFNAVAFAGTFFAPLPEFEQRLFDRRLHHSRYRPSFVDRGNQSESPRCHDSLSPIANLTNSACASRSPNPPAVQVLRDATRDSVHDREIGHTCGSLRGSVADARLSESGEEEDSHPPEDIEPRLRRNLHVLYPSEPNPTDEPRRLRHGLPPDCPKRPDRAARADRAARTPTCNNNFFASGGVCWSRVGPGGEPQSAKVRRFAYHACFRAGGYRDSRPTSPLGVQFHPPHYH